MTGLLVSADDYNAAKSQSDVRLEQATLGALLTRNDCFLHIGGLSGEHFSFGLHRRIFEVMNDLWNQGRTFSPMLLASTFANDAEMPDGQAGAYLAGLCAASIEVTDIGEYAKAIIALSQRRKILKVLGDAINHTATTQEHPAETALSVSIKLSECAAGAGEHVFCDDFEVTEKIVAGMKRDVKPFSTGYARLDDAMGGGLYPGKSYGFAARKKVGKTILAGSISQNLNKKGIRHLFICGEMSPEEIQKRTLGRLLCVKNGQFNMPGVMQAKLIDRINEQAKDSKRAMIYCNAPGLTFDDLKRYVLLARMQKKITGFILDYWQLVGGKPQKKSTAEHLDEVSQWIADTCRKYDLWSIVMAQINQEGNTRGGEGIRLAFDQVYILQCPDNDAGRSERWLDMSDTRYTPWRSVGSELSPGFWMNDMGPHFSESPPDNQGFEL